MNWEAYIAGRIPLDLAERLKVAIRSAPVIQVTNSGEMGSIYYAAARNHEIPIINETHIYHDNSDELVAVYDEVIRDLSGAVSKALQSSFKVLQSRSWETKHGSDIGPDKWHIDGKEIRKLKLMVYSTETENGGGGFQIRMGDNEYTISGPAGTWVLFWNSLFYHRGIPPDAGREPRVATEFTIARAHEVTDAS